MPSAMGTVRGDLATTSARLNEAVARPPSLLARTVEMYCVGSSAGSVYPALLLRTWHGGFTSGSHRKI